MEEVELKPVENSTSFELVMETSFLAELLQEMWFRRRQLVDVLHSSVDAYGYDLVLQTADVTRHVQLKARQRSAATRYWNLSTQLALQPAACVVLLEWERPVANGRLDLSYRWFGAAPHEKIPDLGNAVVKHSRGNAKGEKGIRPGLRKIGLARFDELSGIEELAQRLFGSPGMS